MHCLCLQSLHIFMNVKPIYCLNGCSNFCQTTNCTIQTQPHLRSTALYRLNGCSIFCQTANCTIQTQPHLQSTARTRICRSRIEQQNPSMLICLQNYAASSSLMSPSIELGLVTDPYLANTQPSILCRACQYTRQPSGVCNSSV